MDLLAIAPPADTVDVGGGQIVDLAGIPLHAVVPLLARFPSLVVMFGQKQIDPALLVANGPDAAVAFMAAGAAPPADAAKAEAIIAALPIAVQVEMFIKVYKLTFVGGFGPFVDRLGELETELLRNLVAPAAAAASPTESSPSSEPPSSS